MKPNEPRPRKSDLRLDDLDRRNRYDREAKVYDARRWTQPSGRYYRERAARVASEILAPFGGARVVDIAGGTGQLAGDLARAGAQVTLVDFTWEMLAVARERTGGAGEGPRLIQANARQLPFRDGTFDALVSTRFFHLLPETQWEVYLNEMARVVRSDGLLLLEFDNPFCGVAAVPLLELYRRLRSRHQGAENGWLWPHRAATSFPGLEIVRRDGLYYPLAGRIWVRWPAAADALSATASWRPFCYLTQQVLLTLRHSPTTRAGKQ